jgi:hypothetical protein
LNFLYKSTPTIIKITTPPTIPMIIPMFDEGYPLSTTIETTPEHTVPILPCS